MPRSGSRLHLPSGTFGYLVAIALIAAPFLVDLSRRTERMSITVGVLVALATLGLGFLVRQEDGIGSLARSTSRDVEAGQHTVLDVLDE